MERLDYTETVMTAPNGPPELCILHANCQGEPLAECLAASLGFARHWRIKHYTNYTREAIPPEELATATLFLYQRLGPEWAEISSPALQARLSSGAAALCIPNMFFTGYWPFWTSDSIMPFGDLALDKLIESGAGKPEILRVYLHGPVERMADLAGVVRDSLARERKKEEGCVVPTADLVEARWKTEPLFQTVNHPGKTLLLHVADGILAHLGLPALPQAFRTAFRPEYEGFHLPLHPRVAVWHQLAFGGQDATYPVFGRSLSFAQYISRYIDCRQNGLESDFLGYLQLV